MTDASQARRRYAGAVALTVVGALAGWVLLHLNAGKVGSRDVVSAAPAGGVANAEAPSGSALTKPAAVLAAGCNGPSLHLVFAGLAQDACIGPVSVVQNGSVRRYRVDTQGEHGLWLRIEAAGTQVLSAAVGESAGSDQVYSFQCREADCTGISISRHDAQGIRTIALRDAKLPSARAALDAAAAKDIVITGDIKTLPEEQVAAGSCSDQGVSIVTSDSSASAFCPNGGAGFELGDDGNKTYRFTNLDGASLLVALDDQQRVKQVRYEGDDTLVCKSRDCGRIDVTPANDDGERTFTFAGTTLIETPSGERNAVLNGKLVVPPL